MMSSQVLFFVDKDQVWSPTLVPRTDVDPQTIGKDKKSVRHNPLFQD